MRLHGAATCLGDTPSEKGEYHGWLRGNVIMERFTLLPGKVQF